MAGPIGLDYVAVWQVVAPAIGVECNEETFRLLQALEVDQLTEWGEAAEARERQAAAGHPVRGR